MVESGKVADVVPEYPSSTSRIKSVGALNRLPNVGTWAGEEQLVQPTIPMGRSRLFPDRRGHLLMANEYVKGW